MPTVLIIDDNPAVGTALDVLLGMHEIAVRTAESPEAGLAALEADNIDLVIQDMNFRADTTSGEEGSALARPFRAPHPHLPIILLTAWTHLDTAVELAKAGAADYLAKPWDDRKLLAQVENLLELSTASREVARLQGQRRRVHRQLEERYELCGLVFASDAMA